MAGHSKWKNIKRTKEANDAKKSKVFSKMSKLITVAARDGGGDPDANPRLRLAIDKAKQASMPKDNIEKAIKKGTGELEGAHYEEAVYEGFGPEGVALMMYVLTDNKNRTVAELRNLLGRFGGSLGTDGSTSYIFDSKTHEPSFTIDISDKKIQGRVEDLLEDLDDQDDIQDIYTNYNPV